MQNSDINFVNTHSRQMRTAAIATLPAVIQNDPYEEQWPMLFKKSLYKSNTINPESFLMSLSEAGKWLYRLPINQSGTRTWRNSLSGAKRLAVSGWPPAPCSAEVKNSSSDVFIAWCLPQGQFGLPLYLSRLNMDGRTSFTILLCS